MNVSAVVKETGLENTVAVVNDEARLTKEEVDKLVAEHSPTKSSNGSVITEM